jgi:hypothetical protein
LFSKSSKGNYFQYNYFRQEGKIQAPFLRQYYIWFPDTIHALHMKLSNSLDKYH